MFHYRFFWLGERMVINVMHSLFFVFRFRLAGGKHTDNKRRHEYGFEHYCVYSLSVKLKRIPFQTCKFVFELEGFIPSPCL